MTIFERVQTESLRSTRVFLYGLGGILIFFIGLRLCFLSMPMERDEGEFATIGAAMLNGVPPYQEAYTMKLPGTAAFCAASFSIFGAHLGGLRAALLLISLLNILLAALVVRRFFGDWTALLAGALLGTFAIGKGVYGLWLSAEPIAVGLILAGLLVAAPPGKDVPVRIVMASFLLGGAMLAKQHAVIPALACLAWLSLSMLSSAPKESRLNRALHWLPLSFAAFAAPLGITIGWMHWLGVFPKFKFWTFDYARNYVSGVSWELGWAHCKIAFFNFLDDAPFIWLFAIVGILVSIAMLRRSFHADDRRAGLLLGFTGLAASLFAASMGLIFRGQYFQLAAPWLALFAALGLIWTLEWIRVHLQSTAIAVIILVAAFSSLHRPLFWAVKQDSDAVLREVYGLNPFPEYAIVVEFIKKNTNPGDSVAVFGSEPSLYFLSQRRPAYPYLYVYEMMKPHAHSREMQQEAIFTLELAKPRCAVLVNVPTSWGIKEGADDSFPRWMSGVLPEEYQLKGIIDILEPRSVGVFDEQVAGYQPRSPYTISLLLRKTP